MPRSGAARRRRGLTSSRTAPPRPPRSSRRRRDDHVSSADGALFELVWRDARLNPMKPASSPVVYGGGGAVRVGSAAAAVRPLPPRVVRGALELSVVNCQTRALLCTRRCARPARRTCGRSRRGRARRRWPTARRADGGGRAARRQLLLLAPWEGQPHCLADDAETAPFGATNTFRFDAATGARGARRRRRPRIRPPSSSRATTRRPSRRSAA